MAKRTANKAGRQTKRKGKPKDLAQKQLTDEEKARLEQYEQRAKDEPIKFKKNDGDSPPGCLTVQDEDDPLLHVKLTEALGTADLHMQGHLLDQTAKTFSGAFSADEVNAEKIVQAANQAVAMLAGIQPRDEIEGMLAVQMIGVHNAAMNCLGRFMLDAQTSEGRQCNASYATKMLRTFISQVDTLKRYRTGGQQKMIVEHVHVNEGGQAIVGNVSAGGGQERKGRE